MIEQFNEIEMRNSGLIYNSTFNQIKQLHAMDPDLAGELAISAIELLMCGDISSDDPMIRVMLMPTKAIRDKDKKKHDIKVENSKNKRIADLKLDVIADLTRKGLRQRQIAERLGLTQQTVSNRLGTIRTEFPYLLQDEELVLQENVCKNTSNDLVQTCTNNDQLVQNCTNCETGKNCESDTKKGPKYTSAGRLAELGF